MALRSELTYYNNLVLNYISGSLLFFGKKDSEYLQDQVLLVLKVNLLRGCLIFVENCVGVEGGILYSKGTVSQKQSKCL